MPCRWGRAAPYPPPSARHTRTAPPPGPSPSVVHETRCNRPFSCTVCASFGGNGVCRGRPADGPAHCVRRSLHALRTARRRKWRWLFRANAQATVSVRLDLRRVRFTPPPPQCNAHGIGPKEPCTKGHNTQRREGLNSCRSLTSGQPLPH